MKFTPLYQDHLNSHAKIIEFAGYQMPVQYAEGIKAEHLWVRNQAGLFDVSHMGQALLEGKELAEFCEVITPSNFTQLALGKAKYTVLTNEQGGIIDDLIITKLSEEKFFIVFNAACKTKDINHIQQHLPTSIQFSELKDYALIALQGPKAVDILEKIFPSDDLRNQAYMSLKTAHYQNTLIFISRLGYTGEDGFEISIPGSLASHLWQEILSNPQAKPIGLGARDSLRLEVGYPLYGHDLDDTTSPVEANLSWIIRKQNRQFLGHERITNELNQGTTRLRVGIHLAEKAIAREGIELFDPQGKIIGTISSGGFGPTINGPIAQGYVTTSHTNPGTDISVGLRGKMLPATIGSLNFVETHTKK